jgi:hypothetical protein
MRDVGWKVDAITVYTVQIKTRYVHMSVNTHEKKVPEGGGDFYL